MLESSGAPINQKRVTLASYTHANQPHAILLRVGYNPSTSSMAWGFFGFQRQFSFTLVITALLLGLLSPHFYL